MAPEPTPRVRPPRARRTPRQRPERGERPTAQLVQQRLIESRLTPNAISLTGFALNLGAAALLFEKFYFLAGIAFIVGSIMDTLDGRYSRMSGKGTPFGAFLDSTLDRLEEGVVLTAAAAYFASSAQHDQLAVAAVVVAVLASLMVSYTRARAEALGVECKVGLATRPVRVVILSIGLVFARGAGLGHFYLLAPAIYVLAVLSLFTVAQRIWHVRKELIARDATAAAA
jgi:CDP-diacylglycerol---glycerol-3-phosphate 3-phosphatidyltransferase